MFWRWLATLPLTWQITLPILVIVAIVIIALYGKVWFTMGKKTFGIGKGGNRKRDCMECSKFHRAEAAKVNRKIVRIESSIMKSKMNYVEQKLLDIKRTIYTQFSKDLKSAQTKGIESALRDFSTRIDLILEKGVQNEIRRSIKENGFHERSGKDLNEYIKEQHNVILDIIEEGLLLYYDNELIVSISEAISQDVAESVESIYRKSTEIEIKALADIDVDEYARK
jgi:hypothetical protein